MVSSSDDLYNRKISGKLKLKGSLKVNGLRPKRAAADDSKTTVKADTDANSVRLTGTGRIVSSGNTVQGFETKFVEEIGLGDVIIVKHPTSNAYEERTVQSILSNRTLCVDDAFSNDLITTSVYFIRKQPPQGEASNISEAPKTDNKKLTTVTVREKSGMWSYKTTTKVIKANMTAEDRLNERVKHSRDKFCW